MSKERKTKNHLTGILATASLFTILSLTQAQAAYNGAVLSEIEINPYHGDSYQIMVRTDKGIPIEKQVISDNEIMIDLKNTKPASFVNTIYNNATKVNHVIVQAVSNNRVRILLQGSNMSASKITLDTKGASLNLPAEPTTVKLTGPDVSTTITENPSITANTETNTEINKEQITTSEPVKEEVKPQESEEIILQHPINQFKPIETSINDEEINEEEITPLIQGAMISKIAKKIFNTSNFDWILRFSVLAFLIIAGIKLLKPKNTVKIDLSGDLKSKEIDLFREINNKRGLIGTGLKNNSEISKKPGYNSISNYGIKEYQNSQVPSLSSLNPSLSKITRETKYNKPMANEKLLKSLNTQKTLAKTPSRSLNTSKVTEKEINSAKVNIDSQKFLETMAKIYEKSGRGDLAQGIKHNILSPKIR